MIGTWFAGSKAVLVWHMYAPLHVLKKAERMKQPKRQISKVHVRILPDRLN